MRRLHVHQFLTVAFAASVLLAAWLGSRTLGPAPPGVPMDDWDIARLAAYLNERGLDVRVVSTMREGCSDKTAFLTTTGKGWEDFNRLPKDAGWIARWQGTLYCERGPGGDDWCELTRQWGDSCLVVGPFLLFGDAQLLARVRDALAFTNPKAAGRASRARNLSFRQRTAQQFDVPDPDRAFAFDHDVELEVIGPLVVR